jgi:solute carrier family 25 (adenine nucleotide translocator) protein 4/5/6/31
VNLAGIVVYRGIEFGSYDTLKESIPAQFRGNFVASFAVAWVCTTAGAVVSYPFDTVRRRMMMTSGSGAHYTGFVQAWRHIVAAEGTKALFCTSCLVSSRRAAERRSTAGCGANILRCVAGAMVLSLYDKYASCLTGGLLNVHSDTFTGSKSSP